jgi:hypothetical protein
MFCLRRRGAWISPLRVDTRLCIRSQFRLQHSAAAETALQDELETRDRNRRNESANGDYQGTRHPPRQPRLYIGKRERQSSRKNFGFMKAKESRPRFPASPPIDRSLLDNTTFRPRESELSQRDVKTVADVSIYSLLY